jgi:hypothetical protein
MAASESKEKAEQLKNQANEFFKAEKYGQAIDFYSQVSHRIFLDYRQCGGSGFGPELGGSGLFWRIGIGIQDLTIWVRIRINFNQM